ncbi:MAG: AarF/UbiB family protein [Desulfofustis sp.]
MQLSDLRKLKRFRQIAAILLKYGFDEIVDRLESPGAEYLQQISPVEENLDLFERIRVVLEELGPIFVKFGQIMSLRPDLLPRDLLDELEKLQDSVPAVESEKIIRVLEEDLGSSVSEIFSEFDTEPVAAASLSQVHRGILKSTGQHVAIKIQRPGVRDTIQTELDILDGISRFLDQQFEELQSYELPELVKTVRHTIIREIDFNHELQNMEVARSYAEGTEIYIPKTFKQFSGEKVLVMEFIEGIKFRDILPAEKSERERIARQGLHAAVKQILEDGFFHADPHPGNLIIRPDSNLCIIDWGMAGRLSDHDRFTLVALLSSIVDKNSDDLVNSFIRLCRHKSQKIDRQGLQREVLDLLDRYHAVPLKDMDIGQFLTSLLGLLKDFKLQLPPEMIIMVKALITADGSARMAAPDLNVIEEVADHVHRVSRERYHPSVMWRKFRNSFSNFIYLQSELPNQLHQIVKNIERGEVSVIFRLKKLEQLVETLENASNRLTIGIITAAIIMGSSMIITTGVGPFLFGLPAFGVIGYLLSVVLGLWLVITILRNRRY